MQRAGFRDDAARRKAGLVEAAGEVVVFVAPAHVVFVEAVHALNVGTVQREVATQQFGLVRAGEMPAAQRGVAREELVRGFGFGQIRRPPREFPVGVPRRGHDGEQRLGGGFVEQRAMAAQQAARRSVFHVHGHGVGQRRDVAIQKQQVVARRGADGQVAGGGEAIAVLFLPHDLGRNPARRQEARERGDGGSVEIGHSCLVSIMRAATSARSGRADSRGNGPADAVAGCRGRRTLQPLSAGWRRSRNRSSGYPTVAVHSVAGR